MAGKTSCQALVRNLTIYPRRGQTWRIKRHYGCMAAISTLAGTATFRETLDTRLKGNDASTNDKAVGAARCRTPKPAPSISYRLSVEGYTSWGCGRCFGASF